MKKKIASLLLAAVAAMSGIVLTACDDGDKYDGLKSDKINSAAEWEAAFDFSDVTNVRIVSKGMEGPNNEYTKEFDGDKVNMHAVIYEDDGNKYEWTKYYLYKEDEIFDSEYETGEYDETTGQWIVKKYGTEYSYIYDEDTEKWTLRKFEMHSRDTAHDWFNEHIDYLEKYDEETDGWITLAQRYSEFTYDAKSYAYVAELDVIDEIDNLKVSFKFKNGKVAECSYSYDYTQDDKIEHIEVTVWVTDFGNVNIALPTVEE